MTEPLVWVHYAGTVPTTQAGVHFTPDSLQRVTPAHWGLLDGQPEFRQVPDVVAFRRARALTRNP